MNRKLTCARVAAALLVSLPALAHHSFAMFDHTREVELKDATVIKWEWTNPHSWLYLAVPNGTPVPDRYTIEGNNPGVLRRQGFGIGTLKPGDKVTIYMWPLLSGDKGGALTVVVLADGRVLGQHLQKVQ